ncbi:hypothetical protein CKO28_02965 [Rhodovibrio sodomensis]|uniref:Uncharacterized protein n=1 Tax=Rhodovibrio sodomensis TaxID=1088 RepID=A0ABS1D9W2_9PROT|nr:hypothetical protein [Rhodovibrio sodomensis]MBK1667004.1 hypothetical protein [Rhodovibrio sodomensis]
MPSLYASKTNEEVRPTEPPSAHIAAAGLAACLARELAPADLPEDAVLGAPVSCDRHAAYTVMADPDLTAPRNRQERRRLRKTGQARRA